MNEDVTMESGEKKPGKVLIIDDDPVFLKIIAEYVNERFPDLRVFTFEDPVEGLAHIDSDVDLLVTDLEMPNVDGGKILAYAKDRGVNKMRIIILSSRDADYLHLKFPLGTCLAVLNKHEARQRDALDMVFDSLQKKCAFG